MGGPATCASSEPCKNGAVKKSLHVVIADAVREQRGSVLPFESRATRSLADTDRMALLAAHGGALRARHFHCLRRLADAPDVRRENLTSLTVFHLIEMGLLARDAKGLMRVTPLGSRLLAAHERAVCRD